MSLKHGKHDNSDALEDEFKNLESSKEQAFVWMATRAPTASDKNFFVWVYKNGAKLDLYLYDRQTAVWRGPVSFT